MNTRVIASCRVAASVLVAAALSSGPAFAQNTSKSEDVAKELTRLMDQAKLDSIAAKDPAAPDRFIAALYFPGSQLLVVSAKYTVPVLLVEKLNAKNYRDVYVELNSASVPESKVFIEDLMADGLHSKREANQPFDSYDSRALKVAFDSDWKKQKLSEDDYMKHFGTCDDAYAKILSALLAELKKSSS